MSSEREVAVKAILPMPGLASAHVLHKSSEAHRIGGRPFARPASPLSRRGSKPANHEAPAAEHPSDTLPRNLFLQQLHREKRRADRSQSSLTLIVCRLHPDARGVEACMLAFLRVVSTTVRETDIVGRLGGDAIGILCPDTNGQGTQRLIEKIGSRAEAIEFSTEMATYPDQHFEVLASGDWSFPESNPLFLEQFDGVRPGGYRWKRALDIVGAMLAIVLLSPVFLITALAVKMSSPGPIIFKQKRLGRAGVPFDFYKFRSMRHGNNDAIHRQYVQSLIKGDHDKVNQQNASNPLYKMKADPRVTRVGRFIRKTSIDELPQLLNVLKGDLSLVGPRPPLPYEAENYRAWHLRRVLDVTPGITGLWQVEGRSKVSFDEMVRMDLRYIRRCSLALDLRILLRTVSVVLTCKGAT